MGLFGGDKLCACCGKKVGLLTGTKLQDKKQICFDCAKIVPDYLMDSMQDHWSYQDYLDFKAYSAYSKKELAPQYQETHRYHALHLDAVHGLFYVGDLNFDRNNPPVLLQIREVISCRLEYIPEKIKEGIISDRVTGSVLLDVLMYIETFEDGYPVSVPLFIRRTLAKNVKGKAKIEPHLFKRDEFTYIPPADFSAFEHQFSGVWKKTKEHDVTLDGLQDDEEEGR